MVQGNASDELREFANLLKLPVTNTLMGLRAYPATGDQFVGMLGMHGTYEANMTMHHADVILAVGQGLMTVLPTTSKNSARTLPLFTLILIQRLSQKPSVPTSLS